MEEEKGFTIKDKRTFSPETGEHKTEEPQEAEVEKGAEEEIQAHDAPPAEGEEEAPLPEINFSTFIFSLSSSAFFHFGEIPEPSSGTKKKNLPLAKQTIDILAMLEEKTKGNLTPDEEQLLKNILYDLRIRYVKETQ
ncbi:MAG TPA: DUF1844 domain-containing protein [Desulfobacterales bacterium]|nr:DUF1844 domain-containing protein [Desulfobacterales bacterium]